MVLADISKQIIRYGFYALFLLVPLVFTTDNSELFELSKMWVAWGMTAIILAAWITNMLVTKNFRVQRTPLDIPIMLFLSSQIISTIFSLDSRISLWGYYSRFNGGLLSTFAYVILYYALVTNLTIKAVRRILSISLISATIVVLWGLPAHFGVDPTCYVVRGNFDISCWTDQFVPTVRIFSTLGQPAWMAAYLSFLLPVVLAFFLKSIFVSSTKENAGFLSAWKNNLLPTTCYIILATVFYTALIFTNTRAGFLAFLIGNAFFWAVLLLVSFKKYILPFALCTLLFALCNVFFGIPIPQLQQFSLGTSVQHEVMRAIGSLDTQKQATSSGETTQTPQQTDQNAQNAKNAQIESGVANITDSGNIRKNVWKGAINAWKAYPIFGSGVETFAFAYYQHKPQEQNLTSEWDYLYNKAHNEYLNYLATTGIYGLGTYLLLIGWFWFLMLKWLLHEGLGLLHGEKKTTILHWFFAEIVHLFKHTPKESTLNPEYALLSLSLLAGLLTVYISNFFGFSVVIVNLYFFLAPGCLFILQKRFAKTSSTTTVSASYADENISLQRYGAVVALWIVCFYILYLLFRFWSADKAYALGYNLNRIGQFQEGYPNLLKAVEQRRHEPVFQDELAYGSAVLATIYAEQKDTQNAEQYLRQALTLSDELEQSHPANVVYMKNRVRMLYELSKINPQYLLTALQTIQKAYQRAPNDAKIGYNYGVLLGQTGQVQESIKVLETTKKLKPDFRDVYFALGLFYRDLATKGGTSVVSPENQKKAEENMQYILTNINPNDKQVKDQLSSWKS